MAPQHPTDASPEPGALAGFVEQGLALLQAGSAGPADTAELQRLLKHLRRLEPAALQAMAEAGGAPAASEDFSACLKSLA